MSCQNCNSDRIADVSAKCSDLFGCSIGEHSFQGYVPRDLGIGGGDYVEFEFCADCGQIQGDFPLPKTELEVDANSEPEEDE